MTRMRPETTAEHIARDMREGRFPEQSEPQMVPDAVSLDDPQVRRVYEIMNRDPSRFYADTTCALIVQAFRACLEAGVTIEGEK